MAKLWKASAPSNIALIKYMGKKDHERNIPTNASLSWTLNHLRTEVTLREADADGWSPLISDYPFSMSEKGQQKYLNHLQRLKDFFAVEASFHVQSANNFPADCGIASSASSFAALTEVCCQAFSELTGRQISGNEKAMLSAQGSGSSCRSFMDDFVVWDEAGVRNFESPLTDLSHMVLLVGEGAKKVSSSEAHKRVATSALFHGRAQRSEQRLQKLTTALHNQDWNSAFEITWAEFWDMHALFETAQPPFGYFLPGTVEALNQTKEFWQRMGDGPLVTMDAGPNIHLLWRPDQKSLALQFFANQVKKRWTCLSDIQEIGFAKV